MDNAVDIGAVSEYVEMAGCIGRRLFVSFDHIAVQIDDHDVFWPQVFELNTRWFNCHVTGFRIPDAGIAIRPGHQVITREFLVQIHYFFT
jgi:hypothetical protein